MEKITTIIDGYNTIHKLSLLILQKKTQRKQSRELYLKTKKLEDLKTREKQTDTVSQIQEQIFYIFTQIQDAQTIPNNH